MYVIIYRDGKVSVARDWERTLFFIGLCRRVAHPFKPVVVVPAPVGWPVEERRCRS